MSGGYLACPGNGLKPRYRGVLFVMATKKKKTKYLWPISEHPLDCAILAVDPGKVSGWALWDRGQLIAFGHVSIFENAHEMDAAFARLQARRGPHVLCVERPFGMKFGTATSGAGAGEVTWKEKAKSIGIKRIVRVFPNSWRAKVLPKGSVGSDRKEIRVIEKSHAQTLVNDFWVRSEPNGPVVLHDDEAPALCIGEWCMFAGECNKVLPKKNQVVHGPGLQTRLL